MEIFIGIVVVIIIGGLAYKQYTKKAARRTYNGKTIK